MYIDVSPITLPNNIPGNPAQYLPLHPHDFALHRIALLVLSSNICVVNAT